MGPRKDMYIYICWTILRIEAYLETTSLLLVRVSLLKWDAPEKCVNTYSRLSADRG